MIDAVIRCMKQRTYDRILKNDVIRFLRRRNREEYLCGEGWTRNPFEATTFSDVLEAARVCSRRRLQDVELTLRVHPDASDAFCVVLG